MNPNRQRILDLLATPHSRDELAAAIPLSVSTVAQHLKDLRAAPGVVRVANWYRNTQGSPSPVYEVGSAPDVPPPPVLRVRGVSGRRRGPRAAASAKPVPAPQLVETVRCRRDPLTAAFFGPPA